MVIGSEPGQDLSVLTIAVGKKVYIDMACNLAMSFLLWNENSSINFFLVTDKPEYIPDQLKAKINIIEKTADEIGSGFASKLLIGELLQTKFTLFIDADCLVYGNLDSAFAQFHDKSVSAIGYNRYEGTDIGFCKDIKNVIKNTGVDYFPLLCGSLYFIKKDQKAADIFKNAKTLLKSYDELGLVRLRNKENEEPLLALSMAKFNQHPVADTGLIKADRMFYEFLDTNVLNGKATLWNNNKIPVPEYSTLKLATPLIVHFNASYAETFEYESEVIRLRMFFLENKSIREANLRSFLRSVVPGKLKKTAKDLFRPLYKLLFGYRKVKTSNRI